MSMRVALVSQHEVITIYIGFNYPMTDLIQYEKKLI